MKSIAYYTEITFFQKYFPSSLRNIWLYQKRQSRLDNEQNQIGYLNILIGYKAILDHDLFENRIRNRIGFGYFKRKKIMEFRDFR